MWYVTCTKSTGFRDFLCHIKTACATQATLLTVYKVSYQGNLQELDGRGTLNHALNNLFDKLTRKHIS
jgi:hypothetical protein